MQGVSVFLRSVRWLAAVGLFSLSSPLDAAETFPLKGLKWHLPSCARLDGDILTVEADAQTKGDTKAWADVDLSSYRDGFVAEIEASGENLTKPENPWLGFKFMFSYYDPDMRIDCYPGANGPYGSFKARRFRINDAFPGRRRERGRLHLGLQGATGKVVFDLSTLRIGKADPLFPPINQSFRVAYPDEVVRRGQMCGVMSPANPTEKDFADLRSWGADLMRFQMRRRYGMSEKEERDLDAYRSWLDGRLDLLEKVLSWGEKYGISIVIDLHAAPGGADSRGLRMFYESQYLEEFLSTWRKIATRFKGRRIVYGYDLINEPHQDDGATCDYWTAQRLAAEAVRKIDPETTIIIESNAMDLPVTFAYLSPLAMDNVIYEVHMYNPGVFSHQGVGSGGREGRRIRYPDSEKGWNRAFLANELKPVLEFSRKHRAKIYVGEFSATMWAPGADRYLADCVSLFREYGWDWTYHAFREWEGWSVEHEGSDMDHFKPSSDNPRMRVLKRALRGKTGDLFADGDRVVFLGDSITPADGYLRTICDYYMTRFPNRNVTFIPAGVPGDGVRWCSGRLAEDVLAYQPTVVSSMFGMNDVEHHLPIWERSPEDAEVTAVRTNLVAKFESNFDAMRHRLRQELPDARFCWLTPTAYDSVGKRNGTMPVRGSVNRALSEVSECVRKAERRPDDVCVDVNEPFAAWLGLNGDHHKSAVSLIGEDRVHPNQFGHFLVAVQFLREQHAPGLVSEISVDYECRNVRSWNASVSSCVRKNDRLSFVAHEKSLPLPISPELTDFARSLGVPDDLNREMLSVSGLPSGRWTLSIDGQDILTETSEALAKGVNLALLDTPQYRQSESIRRANARRFDELDHLLGRCRLARWALKRWTDVNPDDLLAVRAYLKELPSAKAHDWPWVALAPYLENWPRRDGIRAEIAKRHDEIRRMAVTVPHRYEIRPFEPAAHDGRTFRFASWNIGHFSLGRQPSSSIAIDMVPVRLREYRAFLDEVGADVIGLCEYSEGFSKDGSVEAKDSVFSGWATRRAGPSNGYSWNAQYFRLPNVGQARVRDYSKRHTEMYYIATPVTVLGKEVVFVETHLDWNTLAPGNADFRITQMRELIEDFKDVPRVVIAGDFNIGHRFADSSRNRDAPEEYNVFKEAGYVLGNDGTFKTFPTWGMNSSRARALDNIIVKGVQLTDFKVWCRPELSDHALISATISNDE